MKNRHGYQADDVNLLLVTQVVVTAQSTDHVSQDGGSAAIVGERLPGTGSRNLLAGTTGGGVSPPRRCPPYFQRACGGPS